MKPPDLRFSSHGFTVRQVRQIDDLVGDLDLSVERAVIALRRPRLILPNSYHIWRNVRSRLTLTLILILTLVRRSRSIQLYAC